MPSVCGTIISAVLSYLFCMMLIISTGFMIVCSSCASLCMSYCTSVLILIGVESFRNHFPGIGHGQICDPHGGGKILSLQIRGEFMLQMINLFCDCLLFLWGARFL
jgi:hypothetical protein